MRFWMILALAGLLCACQQAGQPPAAQQPSARHSDGGGSFFEPEIDALMAQIADRLVDSCSAQRQSPDKINNCIRDRFADAFDDSGQGRRNCDFHTALADYLGCVAIGNTLIDLRHRMSDDTPVPAGFWSGDTAMSEALISSIVKHGLDACGASGPSDRMEGCLMSWFEQRLALPPDMADRCNARAAEGEREKCWGEAFMLRFMRERVPRLGAVST